MTAFFFDKANLPHFPQSFQQVFTLYRANPLNESITYSNNSVRFTLLQQKSTVHGLF
jgi:hypothetical protein